MRISVRMFEFGLGEGTLLNLITENGNVKPSHKNVNMRELTRINS